MNLDDIKRTIEQRAGIPVNLLSGDTVDEVLDRARELLILREENETQRPKSPSEQFVEWMNPGTEDKATVLEDVRRSLSAYPETVDNGEIDYRGMPDGRSAADQFAEWFGGVTAYNPFK